MAEGGLPDVPDIDPEKDPFGTGEKDSEADSEDFENDPSLGRRASKPKKTRFN